MLDLVLVIGDRLDDGEELTDGEPEAIKAVLGFLAARLERVERDVIRHLKYDSETSRTWDEVAAEFGDAYGGRAAIFNRWKRLKDADRRTTSMDMRRGAARGATRRGAGSAEVRAGGAIPRSVPGGVVDTATTPEEPDPNQMDLLTSVDP